ncbi:hypothetical protein BH20ACT14_BH20ACT14_19790 [soil metagenome]
MKRLLLIAAAGVITVVGATLGGLIAPAVAGDGPLPAELREVRAAVAKYHSFKQAERDGYTVAGEPCVPPPPAPPSPAMGVHAVNMTLIDDPAIDPLRPEMLLYAPKANGKLELVGVEYFRRAADQNPTDGLDESDKPSLFGRTFAGIMPGHAPWHGWHYDLHVWVAEANPSGVFAPFNPAISC